MKVLQCCSNWGCCPVSQPNHAPCTYWHGEAGIPVIPDLTSSLADMVEAGVLGTELREVLGPVPEELRESPSPATSWISRARMATSFTNVWLSLKHRQQSRTVRTQNTTRLMFIKYKKRSHKRFMGITASAEDRASRVFWGVLAGCWGTFWLHTKEIPFLPESSFKEENWYKTNSTDYMLPESIGDNP